jgi:CHAT domain-containing protein
MKFPGRIHLYLLLSLALGACVMSLVPDIAFAEAAPTQDGRKFQAEQRLLQGLEEFHTGRLDYAIQFWRDALKLYQQLDDAQGQEITLLGLNLAINKLDRIDDQGDYSRSLRNINAKVKDRSHPVLSLIGLSLAYNRFNQKTTQVVSREYFNVVKAQATRNHNNHHLALVNLGDAYITLGEPAKAVKFYQDSLQIAQQRQGTQPREVLTKLSKAHFAVGESARSLEYHQRSLASAQERSDLPQIQATLSTLGKTYNSLGENSVAANYYQQSVDAAKPTQDISKIAAAILGQGYVAASQGDYSQAITFYQKSADMIERQQIGTALRVIGLALEGAGSGFFTGNQQSSTGRTFSEWLQESQSIGSWISFGPIFLSLSRQYDTNLEISQGKYDRQVTTGLFGLGRSFVSQGEYAKAIEYYQQSLAIARQAGDQPREWAALTGLGEAYEALGETLRANEFYQQSMAINRTLRTRQSELTTNVQLKSAYRALGDYERAIDAYQKSLDLAQQLGNQADMANARSGLGSAYGALGEKAKAIEQFSQSLAIWQTLGSEPAKELTLLNNLADAYRVAGDLDQAVRTYQQSIKLAQAQDDQLTQQVAFAALGRTYFTQNDLPKAIKAYERSLQISQNLQEQNDRPTQQIVLQRLGDALFVTGQYDQSLQKYKAGLDIAKALKNQSEQIILLSAIGKTYQALGNQPAAIAHYQSALAIGRELKSAAAVGAVLSKLGNLQYQDGKLAAAEATLLDSIKVRESVRRNLEDLERVAIFDTQQSSYNTLQKVLVAQKKSEAALEIAERGRARAFVELLAQRLSLQPAAPVTAAMPNLAEIRQIAQDQNATLVQYSIIEEEAIVNGQPAKIEAELYIWVIQPTGTIAFRQVDLKPLRQQNQNLADLVVTHQEFIGARSRSAATPKPAPAAPTASANLTQFLIDPIADLLPTDPQQAVIFVPQGPLFAVAFPALQLRNGNYLIQKHTILTAPSIQVLSFTRQRARELADPAKSARLPLVVGNPTMPEGLLPLPGAEQEAKAIATLLKTSALTGKDATKDTILERLPEASLIHLATHGLLNHVRSLESAIALAPTATDGGLLTAEEILNLRLQANLVVLSACNTGQGKITGDGVLGLSRAFISAGVPSVLVSLWAVPDAPTAALMTAFYQNRQTTANKAQALRQAMLTTLKSHPNPRDWAAFTLIGEAN